jgi:hypothetical protein
MEASPASRAAILREDFELGNEQMISYGDWVEQVVRYARFVADEQGVRKAWIERDCSRTSVTGFDELFEQIFDDLDSYSFRQRKDTNQRVSPRAHNLIVDFLDQATAIDRVRSEHRRLVAVSELLESEDWSTLVVIACRIVSDAELSIRGA